MESLIGIETLQLRREVETLLRDNGIVTVLDFLENSLPVLKDCFDLTFADWENILEIYSLHKDKQQATTDTIVRAAMKRDPKEQYRALIIRLFDEKYVVSIVRRGKSLYVDYIIKSLSRGFVFLSLEDARAFAQRIADTQKSRVIEMEIRSAQENICVMEVYVPQKKKSVLCYSREVSGKQILEAIEDEKNLFEPTRAHKLALHAVDRINRIYDYEIASLHMLICEEDGLFETEELPFDIGMDDDVEEEPYVDKQKYVEALESLVRPDAEDYFTRGRNRALEASGDHSLRWIARQIREHTETRASYEDDAGVTEEDIRYVEGSLEGFRLALEIQNEYMHRPSVIRVALMDCYGLFEWMKIEALGESAHMLKVPGGSTVSVTFLDMTGEPRDFRSIAEEYDHYYLLCERQPKRGKKPRHEAKLVTEQDAFEMTMEFYSQTNKQLRTYSMHTQLTKWLLGDLFIRNAPLVESDEDEDEDEVPDAFCEEEE